MFLKRLIQFLSQIDNAMSSKDRQQAEELLTKLSDDKKDNICVTRENTPGIATSGVPTIEFIDCTFGDG